MSLLHCIDHYWGDYKSIYERKGHQEGLATLKGLERLQLAYDFFRFVSRPLTGGMDAGSGGGRWVARQASLSSTSRNAVTPAHLCQK